MFQSDDDHGAENLRKIIKFGMIDQIVHEKAENRVARNIVQ